MKRYVYCRKSKLYKNLDFFRKVLFEQNSVTLVLEMAKNNENRERMSNKMLWDKKFYCGKIIKWNIN